MSLITLVPQGGQLALNFMHRVQVELMQLTMKWGRGHLGGVSAPGSCPTPHFANGEY